MLAKSTATLDQNFHRLINVCVVYNDVLTCIRSNDKSRLTCSKQDNRKGSTPDLVFVFVFRTTRQRLHAVMSPFLHWALETRLSISNFIKCGLQFSSPARRKSWTGSAQSLQLQLSTRWRHCRNTLPLSQFVLGQRRMRQFWKEKDDSP